MGYHNLAVNGTVAFSCPPGLMLNGPGSVMCSNTAQWEPALSEVEVNCSEDTNSYTSSKKCTESYYTPWKIN
jgi:hypothetical protein